MLVIGVRYLTGYAVATDLASDAAEWPPHPGRVFMALAAAYFDGRGGTLEREALQWLEQQPAPSLHASRAQARTKVEAYVPVNDGAGGVLGRKKQPRVFRKTRPDSDTVYLYWDGEPSAAVREALTGICSRVTRIGYSASLTQVWLADSESETLPAANWAPDEGVTHMRMRVASSGTLRNLETSYKGEAIARYLELEDALGAATKAGLAKIKKQMKLEFPLGAPQPERPVLSVWHGYRDVEKTNAEPVVVHGPFDSEFLVLAMQNGCALGLESTQQLTGALRNAAMKAAGENPPGWLTGHAADGTPSKAVHAAFFPLPYVGYTHADGHVMGLGIALPRELAATAKGRSELRERLGGLLFHEDGTPRDVKLWSEVGRWNWELARETREVPPRALQRGRWTAPSKEWASATPVVLHHFPKKRDGHAEQILVDAVVSAGYPVPEWARLLPVSALAGAGSVAEMPPFTQGGEGLSRYQVHAVIRFSEKVAGPVLIGRGRFRGYGLFAPFEGEGK